MTEYTNVNGKMEKLNTCRILKEKSFATKPLQRKRKTRDVILQIKMDLKEILKENYSCMKTTVVRKLQLYENYSCMKTTVVRKLQLYENYSCMKTTVVRKLQLYENYSCMKTTVV
jgi:hypothetical protein